MSGETIGYAVMPIIPSMRGVQATMDRELGNIVGSVGAKAGSKLGGSFGRSMQEHVGAATRAVATGFTLAVAGAGVAGVKILKSGEALTVMEQRARASEAAILGSTKAANDLADAVDKFSPTTAFPREVFVQDAQAMIQLGFAAKDVVPDLQAVSDAVAATGGGAEQIQAIDKGLERIQVSGKITARDLKQFGLAGVNAADLIGKQMGVTGDQIRSEISKGTLGGQDAIAALVAGMEAKFHSSAGNLVNTFAGAKMRVKSLLTDIGSELTQPFVSNTQGGLAVAWTRQLGDLLQHLDTSVVPKLAKDFSGAADAAKSLADHIHLGHALSDLKELGPSIAAASAGLLTLGSHNLPFGLGQLTAGLDPVVAAVGAFALAVPAARREVLRLVSDVAPLAVEFGSHLLPILHDAQTLAGEVLPPALGAMRIAMKGALDVAIPLADGVHVLTGFLADQPEIVGGLAAAWAGYSIATGIAAGTTAGFVASEEASTIAILANKAAALASTATTIALTVAGAAQAAVVDGLAASFLALATAEVSAGVAAGGIAGGIGAGAVLAISTMNDEMKAGTTAADKFVDSLNIDPTDLSSVSYGLSQIQGALDTLDGKAHSSNWQKFWSEGTSHSARETIAQYNALVDYSAQFEANNKHTIANLKTVSSETGISIAQANRLAQKFGVDLSGSFSKSKGARAELRTDIKNLASNAVTAGVSLNKALKMDPATVAADAKAIQQITSQVQSAWSSFADVSQVTDNPVDPKALKQAEQAVTDAQTRLDRLRSSSGQKEVTNAEARVKAAEREAASSHKTAAESQAAADALATARQNLADVRDSSASTVDDATQSLDQAKQALTDLKATDSPLSGKKIEDFYRTTLTTARTFQANVGKAVQAGFDPALVQRLVEEGPAKAGPILQTLVNNSTSAFVRTVNAGETELQRMTDSAVQQATRFAQLQQAAVNAGTGAQGQKMATELPEAMRIAQAMMTATAGTTIQDIAKAAGTSVSEAKRVASDFGIQISGLATAASDLKGDALTAYKSAVDYLTRAANLVTILEAQGYTPAQAKALAALAVNDPGNGDGSTGQSPPHRATGGPVLAGHPYVVGDGGRPELFVPDTNGHILPSVPDWAIHLQASGGDTSTPTPRRPKSLRPDRIGGADTYIEHQTNIINGSTTDSLLFGR